MLTSRSARAVPAAPPARHASAAAVRFGAAVAATASLVLGLAACSSDSGSEEVAPGPDAGPVVDPVAGPVAEPVEPVDASGPVDPDPVDPGPVAGPPETSARYRLTFDATWSAETHPAGFPGDPHFLPLVGAVHGEQVIFWKPGQIATDGVATVAETGSTAPMLAEVDAAIAAGYASAAIAGGGVPTSPGTQGIEFEVSRDYPQITLLAMLAPSPDWFAGVHGLSLLEADGFVESRDVELILYDAGSDDGRSYTSADAATVPAGTVTRTSSEVGDSPFVDGRPIVGRFVIERVR